MRSAGDPQRDEDARRGAGRSPLCSCLHRPEARHGRHRRIQFPPGMPRNRRTATARRVARMYS